MMRIAYISSEYPPDTGKGGIGTYTYEMAKLMKSRGHSVEVFAASFERTITENDHGVLTHRVCISELKEFGKSIVDIFKLQHNKNPFDLIECPEIGGEASEIKKMFPEVQLVVRFHTPAVLVTRLLNTYQPIASKLRFVLGSLLRGKPNLGFWSKHDHNQYQDPDYLMTEKATLLTAPSEAMKQWAVDFWKIQAERIKVIPNPYVPTQELLDINHENEYKRITFLGRLNVLKGMVGLTKALPAVLKKHPDWNIRFIGNSQESHIPNLSMRDWMASYLEEYKHQIEFIDWIDQSELPKYFAETDIVVIPSLFESFSYVCAEAMSAGCAVVGSKNTAMRELLDSDNYGLLINPKSSKDIANAIIELIKKPELRNELGEKARQKVIDDYNAEKIGKAVEDCYRSILLKSIV